jgi:hypothetical protein
LVTIGNDAFTNIKIGSDAYKVKAKYMLHTLTIIDDIQQLQHQCFFFAFLGEVGVLVIMHKGG